MLSYIYLILIIIVILSLYTSDNNYKNSIQRLGIPDRIIEHGSQDELYNECFYDDKAIYDFCRKMLDHQGSIYEEVTI